MKQAEIGMTKKNIGNAKAKAHGMTIEPTLSQFLAKNSNITKRFAITFGPWPPHLICISFDLDLFRISQENDNFLQSRKNHSISMFDLQAGSEGGLNLGFTTGNAWGTRIFGKIFEFP